MIVSDDCTINFNGTLGVVPLKLEVSSNLTSV